jgi:sugar phosphate isomerase/epimerase
MKNLVCLNSNTYHGFSLEEAVEGAHRAGIKNIELSAVRGWTEHVSPEMTDSDVAAVRRFLSDRGVRPLALGGHSNLTTEQGRDRFRRNLALGHRFGVEYVVTGTGETHGDESEIEDEGQLVEDLRVLGRAARYLELDVAIETHGANFNTGQRVRALVDKVALPNVAVAYDTGNVIFYADTQPYDDLKSSAGSVRGFHLKDKRGAPTDWDFPALGQGDLDLARFASIVESTGCTAPLSIEIEFTPDFPTDVEVVHAAVASSVRALRPFVDIS